MAWEKRVVWSEGMMLQPQHFQQQSRYHEAQLRNLIKVSLPYAWGIYSLKFDHQQLDNGKICLAHAEGVFPDGSYFQCPHVDIVPPALDITEEHLNTTVYLALTIRRHGNTESLRNDSRGLQFRFNVEEHEIGRASCRERVCMFV